MAAACDRAEIITISVGEGDLKSAKSKQKSKTSQWDNKIGEIRAAICALFNNANGGSLSLQFGEALLVNIESKEHKVIDDFVRRVEQSAIVFAGVATVSQAFKLQDNTKNGNALTFTVQSAGRFCTIEYNLYLPTDYQVSGVTQGDSKSRIVSLLESKSSSNNTSTTFPEHSGVFHYKEKVPSGLREAQTAQFKLLKNEHTDNVTLADRMTNKTNKMGNCVSAFANHQGGKLYFGVEDKTYIVEGQVFDRREKEKISNKVKNTLSKLIWPVESNEQQKFWKLDFVPVLENGHQRKDTFVIVLSVAKCPGGVFTAEPESYHLKDGKVEKIPLPTWKEKFIADNCGSNTAGMNGSKVRHNAHASNLYGDTMSGDVSGRFNNGTRVGNNGPSTSGTNTHHGVHIRNLVGSTSPGHCISGFSNIPGVNMAVVSPSNSVIGPSNRVNGAMAGGGHGCSANTTSNTTSLNGVPNSIPVTGWNSPTQEDKCMKVTQLMENLRNNGNWKRIDEIAAKILVPHNHDVDLKLSVIFQCIAAAYRQTQNKKAYDLLHSYHKSIKEAKNPLIFEVQELYSWSAIKRSERKYKESYKYAYYALQRMQFIAPGWITAWFLCNAASLLTIFASEATDVNTKLSLINEAKCYYIAALEHAKSITNYEQAAANLRHRVHINLAMLYMETSPNLSSKHSVEASILKSAHNSLVAAENFEGPPMTGFNEFYFFLAKSDLYYRYFQLNPEMNQEHLKKAMSYANDACRVAIANDFTEVLHYATTRVNFLHSIPLLEDNVIDLVDELLNC